MSDCPHPNCFLCIGKEPNTKVRKKKLKELISKIPKTMDEDGFIFLFGHVCKLETSSAQSKEYIECGILECVIEILTKSIKKKEWMEFDDNKKIPYFCLLYLTNIFHEPSAKAKIKSLNMGRVLLNLLKPEYYYSWTYLFPVVQCIFLYQNIFGLVDQVKDEDVINLLNYGFFPFDFVYLRFYQFMDERDWSEDILGMEYGYNYTDEMINAKSMVVASCFSMSLFSVLIQLPNEMIAKHSSYIFQNFQNVISQMSEFELTLMLTDLISKCLKGGKYDDFVKYSEKLFPFLNDCCNSAIHTGGTETPNKRTLAIIEMLLKNEKTMELTLNSMSDTFLASLRNENLWKLLKSTNSNNLVVLSAKSFTLEYKKKENKQDQIQLANKIKDQGNEEMKKLNIEKALEYYSKSIEVSPKDSKSNSIFYSNRSECHLRLKKYKEAILDATTSIIYDVNNKKSYRRRAKAYLELGNITFASNDLQHCGENVEPMKGKIIEEIVNNVKSKFGRIVLSQHDDLKENKTLPPNHADKWQADDAIPIQDSFKYILNVRNEIHGTTENIEKKQEVKVLRSCNTCDKKEKERKQFFICSQCKKSVYCGLECQKKDWKKHKINCKK
eukprot:gene11977-5378_t